MAFDVAGLVKKAAALVKDVKAATPSGFKSSEGLMTGGLVAVAVARAPAIFDAVAAAPADRVLAVALGALAEVVLYVGLGAVIAHYSLNRTRVKVAKTEAEGALAAAGVESAGAPAILSDNGDEDGEEARLGFRIKKDPK